MSHKKVDIYVSYGALRKNLKLTPLAPALCAGARFARMNRSVIFQVANDILYDVRSLIGDIRNNENKLRPQQMPLENTLKEALGQ